MAAPMDWSKFEFAGGATPTNTEVSSAACSILSSPMGGASPGVGGGMLNGGGAAPGMGMNGGGGGHGMLDMSNNAEWDVLRHTLQTKGAATSCLGVAGRHDKEFREEALVKLIGNHHNLLKDVCNPSPEMNIENKPLTQTELVRVAFNYAKYVDEGLQEVARRLLGFGDPQMLHPGRTAVEARAACARYLAFRIQSHPDQKPGRTPDMSPRAYSAMMAVIIEVGSTSWEPLHTLLERVEMEGVNSKPDGAAAGHDKVARLEAATKIITNHFRLCNDVCNPMKSTNVDLIELGLTQPELTRVAAPLAPHVDEGLRETARRLIGKGAPEGLNPAPEAVEARCAAARYLHFRIQSAIEQRPGRTPDMSPAAYSAMMAVLIEVGSTAWEPLHSALKLSGVNDNTTGAAQSFPKEVRQEAAKKVLSNHFNLLLDVTNPSHLNIEGVKKTQLELIRATAIHAQYVDEHLREAVRRLIGHGQPMHVSSKHEAQEARAICAEYLDTRIQDRPDQKPGRKPDMSTPAARAFKAVLRELASNSAGSSALMRRPSVDESGVRAVALAGQLEVLARQLKMNGEVTPTQMRAIREHLDRVAESQGNLDGSSSTKSSTCLLM